MTLAASVLAGLMWDRFGPTLAFLIGAGLSVLALIVLGALRWRTAFGAREHSFVERRGTAA